MNVVRLSSRFDRHLKGRPNGEMIGAFQLLCHVVMIALHSDAFPLFPEYAVSTRIPKIYRLMKVIVNNFNKKQKEITKKEPFAYLHRNFQFQECICKLGQK